MSSALIGKRIWLALATAFLWSCTIAFAHEGGGRESLTNFDHRATLRLPEARGKSAVRVEQKSARAELKERLPDATVDFEPVFGSPKWIHSAGGALTGPNGEGRAVRAGAAKRFERDPEAPVKTFLEEHRGLFRHGAEVLSAARQSRNHTNAHGLRTVVWEQQVDGIPVFDSVLVAHTRENGELVAVSSQFVPQPEAAADRGTANRKAKAIAPPISATAALRIATENLGEPFQSVTAEDAPKARTLKQTFRIKPLPGDASASLVWLPIDGDTLRLCWEVEVNRQEFSERFRLLVDAETGAVLVRRKLTVEVSEVQYRVYTSDSPSPLSPSLNTVTNIQPPLVPRQLLTISNLNPVASPLGWLSDGVMETRGNNVDAHLDRDADDRPDLPRPQATLNGSGQRVFDFPLDLTLHPTNYQSAAVLQLFYWCNFTHDRLYELGFTESAGNFQKDNFGRGGADNDPIFANAQDGSGFNNANFTPTRDGVPGKIQMFIFNGPNPARDGDLDAEVVIHEYVHGLTDRAIGGGVGISQLQTYGMAEGWSDFYALALLAEPNDDVGANYAMGGYVTYQFSGLTQNYYYGIRRYPYSTNKAVNPLTFRDIDLSTAANHVGIPINPVITSAGNVVHRQGEIWCSMLWDMRAALLRKYAPSTAEEYYAVNMRILGYVTRGLQLSPPNPNFVQARDAILLAIQSTIGFSGDTREAWAAFARRGLGVGAICPDSSTTVGVVESYAVPQQVEFTVTPSGGSFSGPNGGPFAPTTLDNRLVNGGATNIAWAAAANANWIQLATNRGVLAPNATFTNVLQLTPVASLLPVGTYSGNVFYTNLNRTQVVVLTFTLEVDAVPGDALAVAPQTTFQSQGPLGGPFNPGSREYQLINISTGAVGWVASTATPWLFLSATNGTIAAGGQFGLTVSIGTNAVTLGNGTYSGSVNVVNTNSGVNTLLEVSLRVGTVDYLTEEFVTSPFDLQFSTMTLTPDGSENFYRACRESVSMFPIDPAGSTPITLADDEYKQIVLTNGATVSVYGISSNAIYIGANGNLTFNPGPNTNAFQAGLGFGEFFGRTRVAPLYADLNPAREGTVVWKQLSDRLVVTWLNVVEFGTTNLNNLQAEMWFNGVIRMTWLNIKIDDPNNPLHYTGLSRGSGAPPDFVKSDLSAYGACVVNATVLLPPRVTEGSPAVTGTLLLSAPLTNDLVVNFSSSDTNEIQFFDFIVVPSGQTIAQFGFEVVDDGIADGSRQVAIFAHPSGLPQAQSSLFVDDAQTANLTLNIASTGTEGTLLTAGGTVSMNGVAPRPIQVFLASANTNRAVVPPFVLIPAGQSAVSFDITLVDNDWLDGTENVVIETSVTNWNGDFDVVRVFDNDSRALSLTLPAEVTEGQGMLTNAGTITFAARPLTNVVLSLSSDRPEILLPLALVTNLAGQTLAHFNLLVDGNPVTNDFESVRITVTATGFLASTGTVGVIDDERPFAPTEPVPANLATHVPRDTTLEWTVNPLAPEGTLYDVYLGITPTLTNGSPIATTSGSSITLPAQLTPDTTYYWQVVARLSPFPSEASPVWQFRTVTFGLEFAAVASPQYVNEPFAMTVTARDSLGLVVTNYASPITLTNSATVLGSSSLVITEVDVNGFDRTEFQNVSGRTLNLSGWRIVLYDWQTWPEPFATFTVPTGTQSQPGDVFILRSFPPSLPPQFFPGVYPNFAIAASTQWNVNAINNPIAVLVLDAVGNVVDFLCAVDADPALITTPVSITTNQWSGAPVPANIDPSFSYQRVGNSDGNSLADWVLGTRNISTNNPGLPVGFSNVVSVPFTHTPFVFESGSATASVTVLSNHPAVYFGATGANGKGALSGPIQISTLNDLLISGAVINDVVVSSPLVYTLTITNNGPANATSVRLTNDLGTNASFISAMSSQGGCFYSNGIVICDIGTLSGGTSANVAITAFALTRGVVTNLTRIGRGEADGNPGNDQLVLTSIATFPQISILDITNAEPNTSTQSINFTLRLSAPSALTSTVAFATSDGTATAELDYRATNGVVTFLPGVTNRTVSVLLIPDSLAESNETFFVTISSPVNLEINRSTAQATITDNDPIPTITPFDVTVTEGDFGTEVAIFSVRLSAVSGRNVSVLYATVNGTALAEFDYRETYGQLIFPPGTTNMSVAVPIFGDALSEPTKTFTIQLSSALGGTIGRSTAVGTILDNDIAPLAGFTFEPLRLTNYAGAPFSVSVTARAGDGSVAGGFQGPFSIVAIGEQRVVNVPTNGTNVTWNLPLGSSFHDVRVQSIYLTNEIGAAGRINGLALDVAQLPGQILSNFTIRTRFTPESSFVSPAWHFSWATNFRSDVLVSSTGWMTFRFDTPVQYGGGQNLIVDISFNNSSFSFDGLVRAFATAGNRSMFLRTDSAYGSPLDWSGNSPTPSLIARVPSLRLLVDRTPAITAVTSGEFVAGVWNGAVRMNGLTTNVQLRVTDGYGHSGDSSAFALIAPPALAIERTTSDVRFRFPTLPGSEYVLEASSGLNGGWSTVSPIIVGDGSILTLSNTPPAIQQFYRLQILK